MKHHAPDFLTVTSILAAITSNQEQVEWWLRCAAAFVAILAGVVALYHRLRKKRMDGEDQ